MEKLIAKYRKVASSVEAKIRAKLRTKAVESEHRSGQVLKVKDDNQFNLSGGRYLTEITATELIDNEGYIYSHSELNLELLCIAVDSI